MGWIQAFGKKGAPPREVHALLERGEAADLSWKNDAMPSYGGVFAGVEVRLWADFADPDAREYDGARFQVTLVTEGATSGEMLELYTGDDVAQAVATYRAARHLLDPSFPLPRAPADALVGPDAVMTRAALDLDVATWLTVHATLPAFALGVGAFGGQHYLVPLPLAAARLLPVRRAPHPQPIVMPTHVLVVVPERRQNPAAVAPDEDAIRAIWPAVSKWIAGGSYHAGVDFDALFRAHAATFAALAPRTPLRVYRAAHGRGDEFRYPSAWTTDRALAQTLVEDTLRFGPRDLSDVRVLLTTVATPDMVWFSVPELQRAARAAGANIVIDSQEWSEVVLRPGAYALTPDDRRRFAAAKKAARAIRRLPTPTAQRAAAQAWMAAQSAAPAARARRRSA